MRRRRTTSANCISTGPARRPAAGPGSDALDPVVRERPTARHQRVTPVAIGLLEQPVQTAVELLGLQALVVAGLRVAAVAGGHEGPLVVVGRVDAEALGQP